ncbi:hypothetical protein [Actinoallomurus sp. CA-150999]|uniref:hypothetical protein n=1 Tax=Actinoallomurus sp. CA-150999 TaxID=3239887 RepID=UPI003D945C06
MTAAVVGYGGREDHRRREGDVHDRIARRLRILALLLGVIGFALPTGAGTASAYAASGRSLSAVSASAYGTAATVSSAVGLATKHSTLRTWAAEGASASSAPHAASGALAVVPGRTATGTSWRRLATVADLSAAPRQASALTPRGRGPPSITGS